MIETASQSRSTSSSWWLEKSTAAPAWRAPASTAARASTADRIEAGERLVQDQHVRLVHQRGGQLDALLVAQRQRLDAVVTPLGDARAARVQRSAAAAASPALAPCSRAR